jgi:hypothetical protein
MKFLAFGILLASGVEGAFLSHHQLQSSTTRETSNALRAQSEALDRLLQSVAGNLAPGATRDFLTTLRLCAPCQHYERFGEAHDGGYVMCSDGLDKGLVGAYSYGISGYDGWGMAIASRYHVPLHEYDCTNFQEPLKCAGCDVHFHGECILNAHASPRSLYKKLAQQLQESGNGQAQDRSLLLKIDVEAAEWDVFAEEPVENLRKFREIVVEYHWLDQVYNHGRYLQAVKRIEEAGFAVTHLHGNNFGGGLQQFGEYKIPRVLEVTYIQKPSQGCAANIPYRLSLDTPNNANLPELGDAVLPTSP